MACVLLVEDEPLIAENLIYALSTEGFQVRHSATLGEAEQALAAQPVDLVILDVNLPDGNGFEFFHRIHDRHRTPVIFLTARASEIDRVLGLEMGGDDYVVKPVSPRELAARVRAVLRRGGHAGAGPREPSSVPGARPAGGGFSLDHEAKTIRYRGQALDLSACEYRLLEALLSRPGKIFSRDELLTRAWADPGASLDRTIDAHVKNIRRKLEAVDPEGQVIRTHRGFGYSLAAGA